MEKMALSVAETAQVLGISRPMVYRLLNTDGFPVFQIGGRRLVSATGLKRWVEDQTEVKE